MKATVVLPVWLLFLIGCSGSDAPFRGFNRGSGDLVPLVVDHAIRHGARSVNTNSLPKIEAQWRYRSEAEGVQFYVAGDHFPEVQSFLLSAFGPPTIPATTNANGEVLGVYTAPVAGVRIQFGREDRRDGARYTTIRITGRGVLKP